MTPVTSKNKSRSSGILAHITSLPSQYGIGDLGPSSKKFIDYLVECNQTYWQFLPTSPTKQIFDNSPYMSTSAFAGSFLLLSPDLMYKDKLLSKSECHIDKEFSPFLVEFRKVIHWKQKLLEKAFYRFKPKNFPEYDYFIENNKWLDDYTLFSSLKKIYKNMSWHKWPQEIANREEKVLQAWKQNHIELINYFNFEQFLFFKQWQELKTYAEDKSIQLFGDLPIYVGFDSVDVWSNREIFFLDKATNIPIQVSGVPPDYFSKTGQRWGNPLYNWQDTNPEIKNKLYGWWEERLAHLFKMVDQVRIDHFRGFESYWAIDENEKTAVNGKWCKGPGMDFFTRLFKKLGTLDIVAEDLGIITPEVEKLRDAFNFPGMKVLQFGFDGDLANTHLPYNFPTRNCIVYTGTHDNDTSVGWYLSEKVDDSLRERLRKYANSSMHDSQSRHDTLIYLAQSSIAYLSIFPLQDVLGFGNDCKMNTPGLSEGNWRWRCHEKFLTTEIAAKISDSTNFFGRGRHQTTKSEK